VNHTITFSLFDDVSSFFLNIIEFKRRMTMSSYFSVFFDFPSVSRNTTGFLQFLSGHHVLSRSHVALRKVFVEVPSVVLSSGDILLLLQSLEGRVE